jgi:predicted O-methyltransferase YrrM
MRNVIQEVLVDIDQVKEEIAPDVGALSSKKIRVLLHRLAERLPRSESYVEIGTHIGGTLISGLLDQKDITAYACDNWCFPYSNGKPAREVFFQNLQKYKDRLPEIKLLEMDAFEMLKNDTFEKPVGIYFYDADHSEESQYKAIVMMYPYLADESIVVVDDFGMPQVQSGTWRAVRIIRPKELYFWAHYPRVDHDAKEFWNGIGVLWIKK